jgi:hypothetical protein
MTLLELVLVLAVLVAIAALAVPALDRPLASQRLKSGADLVRSTLVKARVEAMHSGEVQLFRFLPESGEYQVERFAGLEGAVEQSGFAAANLSGMLPDGILFLAADRAETARDQAVEMSQVSAADDAGWSQPIMFYADGTTSTALLLLRGEYGMSLELSLRGLTGGVQVSEVYVDEAASSEADER